MLTDSPRSRVYSSKVATPITQFRFVKRDGTTSDIIHSAANGENIIGIAMESRTATAGVKKDVTVALVGEMYDLEAGGALALGDPIESDANGRGVKATVAADFVAAIALAPAAASGDIIPVRITPCLKGAA